MHIGPYEVLGELGKGGMGVVYRAKRADLDRDVALKVLPAGGEETATLEQRFRREAQAAAKLAGHPGIVGVHDVGEANDAEGRRWLYLAMDLVEGPTLQALAEEGELTPAQCAAMVRDAARAVAYAHRQGILHRDIKPANLMRDAAGTVRVADFGLARSVRNDAALTRLTQSGEMVGTPAYMSPEQALDGEASPAMDVYSLGATLYEMLAGDPPFAGSSVIQVVNRVLKERPVALRAIAPHVPAPLEAIVFKCLEKEPGDRYPSADALADDLDRFLQGSGVAARPAGMGRSVQRAAARNPLAVAIGGGVAALLLAGLGYALWTAAGASREAQRAEQAAGTAQAASAALELGEAYRTLSTATLAAMRRLEDRYHGAAVPDEEVEAALASVQVACDALPDEPSMRPLRRSWSALARVFAGDSAAGEQLEALAKSAGEDPFPHLMYARARLAAYTNRFDIGFSQQRVGAVELDRFVETPERTQAREQAEAAMRDALESPLWHRLKEAQAYQDYAHAVSQIAARQWDAAAASLELLALDPLLGREASLLAGIAHHHRRAFEEAARAWMRNGQEGWPHAWMLAGLAWLNAGSVRRTGGAQEIPEFDTALQAFDQAIALDDRQVMAWVWRARCRILLVETRATREAQLEGAYDAALADLKRAQQLTPNLGTPLMLRSQVLEQQFQAARRLGRDPTPYLTGQIGELERLAGSNPDYAEPRFLLGDVRRRLALYAVRRRRDPEALLRRAEADYRRAVELEPATVRYRLGLGALQTTRAEIAIFRDGDPQPWFEAAARELEAAAEVAPDDFEVLDQLVGTYTLQARGLLKRDLDPRALLEKLIAATTKMITARPTAPQGHANRATAYSMQAEARQQFGGDVPASFERALRDVQAALELDPNDFANHHSRALVHRARGAYFAKAGGDWRTEYRRAVEACEQATRINPKVWQSYLLRGMMHELLGAKTAAAGAYAEGLEAVPGNPALTRRLAALRRR